MFEGEEWCEIEDLPHYMISTHGRVKRKDSDDARKVYTNDKGFPVVLLYGKDSKSRYLRQINKLVATAFLNPPVFEDENAVWHIDGDLTNCLVSNLRWDTRGRVLDWNDMNRNTGPKFNTPKVKNNRTGKIYENAYECGLAEGRLESEVIFRVEKQARNMEDDKARYRYIFKNN